MSLGPGRILVLALTLIGLLCASAQAAAPRTMTLPEAGFGPPLRSIPSAESTSSVEPAVDPETSTPAVSGSLYWTILESLDDRSAYVVGVSDDAQSILYKSGGGGYSGYYVFDRSRGASRRVDVFFDGTPLPEDVQAAAISGDGSTVVLLLKSDQSYEPTLRIVRLDRHENYEVTLPDPGSQTWLSGWVEHCSLLTRLRELHLSEDGDVAWLTTSPCYYDKVLALDISSPTLRWQFITSFRGNTEEVTADGRSFALGVDLYYDYNWNGTVDPDEPTFSRLYVFPIEFFDNDAEPGNAVINWPSSNWACEFPSGARARVDGAAKRMVVSSDQVGLDPDTVVYTAGQQLYWAGRDCHMHSLGDTEATEISQFAIGVDGRSVLQEAAGGAIRTELPTGQATSFNNLTLRGVDPFLHQVAATGSRDDPGGGQVLGSLLEVAQLSANPSALKVAIVGDSYISGEGSFGYESGTDVRKPDGVRNLCHRSVSSWAYQLGQRLAAFRLNSAHPLLRSFACSGATTANIEHGQYTEPSQIDRLRSYDAEGGRPVDLVFASAGGNDAGFKSIIETCMAIKCLSPGWQRDRLEAVEAAAANVEETLEHIKAAAPHATVFLSGYPSIVDPPDGSCGDIGLTAVERALLHYSAYAGALVDAAGGFRVDAHEQAWLNGTLIPTLNRELGRAAAEAGVRWIDPSGWFHGHGICSSDPYGNGLAAGDDFPSVKPFLGNESFHPNPDGYAQMAARIEFELGPDFRPDHNPAPTPQGINHSRATSGSGAMVLSGQMQAWGDQGRVTIQGQSAGSKVVLGMYSSPTLLGSGTVAADGTVELPYEMPAGIYPGLHVLVAYDEESGEPLATSMTSIEVPEGCLATAESLDRDGDDLADRCDASYVDGPAADGDGDGIENAADDCPADADPAQLDADENGVGDACDPVAGYNAAAALEPFPQVSLPRPAPKITVLSQPKTSSNSDAAEIVFAIAAEDPSAVGLTSSCWLDGVVLDECSSPLELDGLGEGFHHVELDASSSNGSARAEVFWWIDTVPPGLAIVVPRDGQRFSYGSAVAPVVTCDGSCFWQGLSTSVPGTHSFTATATDPAGNVTSKTVSYVVDPPVADGRRSAAVDAGASVGDGRAVVSAIARARSGALVTLRCPGDFDCSGVVAGLSAPSPARRGRARHRRGAREIGQAVASIGAGQTVRLGLSLDAVGRAMCAKKSGLAATVRIEQLGSLLAEGRVRPCPRRARRARGRPRRQSRPAL